LTQYFTL